MQCALTLFNLALQKQHFGTLSECGLYILIHPVAIPLGPTDLSLWGALCYFRKKSLLVLLGP